MFNWDSFTGAVEAQIIKVQGVTWTFYHRIGMNISHNWWRMKLPNSKKWYTCNNLEVCAFLNPLVGSIFWGAPLHCMYLSLGRFHNSFISYLVHSVGPAKGNQRTQKKINYTKSSLMKMARLHISDDLSKHNPNIFRKPMTRKSTKIPINTFMKFLNNLKKFYKKSHAGFFGKVLDFLSFWTGPKTAWNEGTIQIGS